MAFTQADVDKIKAAIAAGVKRVRFRDREVEYRSLEEMKDALELIEKELNPRPSYRLPYVDKMGPLADE